MDIDPPVYNTDRLDAFVYKHDDGPARKRTLVLQGYLSLALLTPADFRPAHRARTSTLSPTAYPGIRAVQQLAQFCTPPSRSPQHPQKSPGL